MNDENIRIAAGAGLTRMERIEHASHSINAICKLIEPSLLSGIRVKENLQKMNTDSLISLLDQKESIIYDVLGVVRDLQDLSLSINDGSAQVCANLEDICNGLNDARGAN